MYLGPHLGSGVVAAVTSRPPQVVCTCSRQTCRAGIGHGQIAQCRIKAAQGWNCHVVCFAGNLGPLVTTDLLSPRGLCNAGYLQCAPDHNSQRLGRQRRKKRPLFFRGAIIIGSRIVVLVKRVHRAGSSWLDHHRKSRWAGEPHCFPSLQHEHDNGPCTGIRTALFRR